MPFLEVAVGTAAVLALLPTIILTLEILASLLPERDQQATIGTRPRVAVLIPAHNEAAVIANTLQAIREQLRHGDRLLVVADNCSDETAAVAAAATAEVAVRQDSDRRGKGYALDFGIRHLEVDPPEVVIVIDADCHVSPGSIDRVARTCAHTGRPVQALNLALAPAGAGAKVRIAEFAFALKNRVRALGLRKLGLPCHLMGTGMAFTWECINSVTLATGHIVEDLQLGIELARGGHPALFCPQALVTSYFPTSEEGFKTQRTRWEHGYLGVLAREMPAMLAQSLRAANGRLLTLALDLSVPPIALLTLLTACIWAASVALYLSSHREAPFAIASTAMLLLLGSIMVAWIRYGRRIVSLSSLLLAVGYALWKVPMYGRFLVTRQMAWVRSKRD